MTFRRPKSPTPLMTFVQQWLTILFIIFNLWLLESANSAALHSPCPRALKINTNYQFRNALHFVCLQSSPESWPRLEVIQFNGHQLLQSVEVRELGVNQLSSFVDQEGTLRILLAVPGRINGTSMYSMDKSGRFLQETHTINTQLVSAMTVWKLDLNWDWQLAIANQPDTQRIKTADSRPMISLHSWRSSYFDFYQLIYLPREGRISKLEPMQINGQEMLVVAMKPNRLDYNSNNNRLTTVDSLIYKLDFSDASLDWKLFQSLPTRQSLDVSSFAISHRNSLQTDFYLAFVSLIGDNDDARINATVRPVEDSLGLVIYKYLGNHFTQTHSELVPGATKLDAISYQADDSYVVIALLSEWSNRITLYLFDGLQLKPLSSPFQPSSNQVAYNRQRRTMHSPNLHLFKIPQIETGNSSDNLQSVEKRTLNQDDPSRPQIPLLVFTPDSNGAEDEDEAENDKIESKSSMYEIPVEKSIQEEKSSQDEAHSKRNQIGVADQLLGWCKSTIDSILGDNFQATFNELRSLPRINQAKPVVLNGDLIIEDDLYVSNLLLANNIQDVSRMRLENVLLDAPGNYSQTFEQIMSTHREIDQFNSLVNQILVDDGSDQHVFNPLTFQRLLLDCPNGAGAEARLEHLPFFSCPQVSEIRARLINARDISDINAKALLTGRTIEVNREVRFEHLVLHGQVDIMDSLNGIPIQEIVFKRGPSGGLIGGPKKFLKGLYANSQILVNSWNGVKVERQNFLTSSGEQRIEANLGFKQVVLEPELAGNFSSRVEKLNGLHLDSHLAQLALANDDNKFEAPLNIDRLVLNGPIYLKSGSRLDNVDIENLWLNAMFKQSHQNVTARMEFLGDVHLSYGGDMIVRGPINGINLTPNSVLMKDRDIVLPNPVIFENDLQVANNVQLRKALNGVQVAINRETQQYELGILYDGGQQTLSGDKILFDVKLGGNSTVLGAINGHLNLSQLFALANNNYGEPYRFQTIRLTGDNIVMDDRASIYIDSTVNGLATNDICQLAVRLSESPLTYYRRLRFEQPIHLKSLRCSAINGFNNLTSSFLTKHGNQQVRGSLNLLNGVIFDTKVDIVNSINQLDVSPLSRAIVQIVNENRTGHKVHEGDLIVDELIVDRINDLPLGAIFLAKSDTPQVVTAPLTFDHLDIENVLAVGENLVAGAFNGINLTNLLSNTLQYDAPQLIYSQLELQTLQLLPGANFLTDLLNGFNLNQLYSDSVLVDVPQQILAPKVFNFSVEFADRLYLRFGIDGLTDDEFRFNLLLHSDDLINGDVEFTQDVFIRKELDIRTGLINDIDVNQFVQLLLSEKSAEQKAMRIVGNGSVRFKDVRLNNLVLSGTIQGVDLSRDAITKSDNLNGSYDSLIIRPKLAPQMQPLPLVRPPPVMRPLLPLQPLRPLQSPRLLPPLLPLQPLRSMQPPLSLPPLLPQPLKTLQPLQPLPWQPQLLRPVQVQSPLRPPASLKQFSSLVKYNNASSYRDFQVQWRDEKVKELALRVNRFLAVDFYYEIVQKHPQFGPPLHTTSVEGNSLLLLKAAIKPGEPCLKRGQTIAVMAKLRATPSRSFFQQISRLQETSAPTLLSSVKADQNYYLFVLDSIELNEQESSQVLVYLWNKQSSMYEMVDTVVVDGFPTAMKAFAVNGVACVAMANPQLVQMNLTGSPSLYCQQKPSGDFTEKLIVPIFNVYDLDILSVPNSAQILIATWSQLFTELIGDLNLHTFDIRSKSLDVVAIRRTVRPLKLHLFRNSLQSPVQLVVSEAITSNEDTQAITRIFTLRGQQVVGSQFYETQLIRDNQFFDIQTVKLNELNSLLLMQSAHSISIYAPSQAMSNSSLDCDSHYTLLQRLHTRGADKFLAFNERQSVNLVTGIMDHYLVLSKDNCELQQHSTIILKAKFR